MFRLKLKWVLLLLLLFFLPPALPAYASGIVPRESFVITPEEGHYRYPENFELKEGEEYLIAGETEEDYLIKYEVLSGIFIEIHVPKHKVEYLEKTQREEREEARQEAEERFAREQEAKGLIKAQGYWVTPENAELWLQFLKLKRRRNELIRISTRSKKSEAELTARYEKMVRLLNQGVPLEQEILSRQGWLEEHKVSRMSSGQTIKAYNKRVHEINALNRELANLMLEVKKERLYHEKLSVELGGRNDTYREKAGEYLHALSRLEVDLADSLTTPQAGQKDFLLSLAKETQSLSRELAVGTSRLLGMGKKNNIILVSGRINEMLDAVFIVDTGASMVVISEKMAEQLEIKVTPDFPRQTVQLADGSLRQAPVTTLASVAVAGLKQPWVRAGIIEDAPDDFTPLLGMSFLRHFNWRLEGNNKIVFERLELGDIP